MAKSVMLSIQPKWCELIAKGQKTIEVRKTRPKLPTPFKCYIYCTKAKKPIYDDEGSFVMYEDDLAILSGWRKGLGNPNGFLGKDEYLVNGMVMGEFTCTDIQPMTFHKKPISVETTLYEVPYTCLRNDEIADYLDGDGYAWHISDLVIYGEPKPLTDFYRPPCERMSDCGCCPKWDRENRVCKRPPIMLRAPQSWCYVEEL